MKAHTMQTYVFIEEKDFSNQQIVNDDVVFRLKALAQSTTPTAKVQQHVSRRKQPIRLLKYKNKTLVH